jgi:hypothetical protein
LGVIFLFLGGKQAVQVYQEPLLPLGGHQATLGKGLIVIEVQQTDTCAEVNQGLNEVALHLSYGSVQLAPIEVVEAISIDIRVVDEDGIHPKEQRSIQIHQSYTENPIDDEFLLAIKI